MKAFINILCIAFIFLITSCNSEKKKETNPMKELQVEEVETKKPVGDNSMTSLDWAGTYRGELPCASCEGIKTVITINSDGTYTLQETYLGKETTPTETKGNFEWDDEGQRIRISEDRHAYFVGENTLTLLDHEGNKNVGDHEALYVLTKDTN